ncbi:MAG: type II toxin-antitoxin system RelE/ParE family toxin [Pseudomonadota bacterium]
MIKSYLCRDTQKLADHYQVRRFIQFERVAQRKLAQLNAAATLDMLRVPPGNHLEALHGGRTGQYSIRINKQWRLSFRFEDGHAYDVEIIDYH